MTPWEVEIICERLAQRGYLVTVGENADGSTQYEVTDKGTFAIALDNVKKWAAA